MSSYYQIINGQRYDRGLLEEAERLTQGRGDGRISKADAVQLFDATLDGGNLITATELRTLRYILEHFKTTQAGAAQLRKALLSQTPVQRAIHTILWEVFDLKGMKWVIDDQTVIEHTAEYDNLTPFPLALREMIEEFLNGLESSTSLRDIVSMELGVPLENHDAATARIREALNRGTLLLFPPDWLERIQAGNLDFKYPPFHHPVEKYWPFGLRLPDLPAYYFVGFVSRKDWWNVYHTGYR